MTSLTSPSPSVTIPSENFVADWGELSPSLIELAQLYDTNKWKELTHICETNIKTSTKKLKSKKTAAEAPFQLQELTLARAFLARAYLGVQSYTEAETIVDSIQSTKKEALQDFRVLRLLKDVLLVLHQSDTVTTLYASAYTATKGQVAPLGDELFLAYGRTCDFMSQQKLAMKMYRTFKDPKYAVWAATAIMLQLTDDTDAGKQTILLMTAERLLSKVALELKDKGQASELYLNILERQQKYKEAIDVLTLHTSVFAQNRNSKAGEQKDSKDASNTNQSNPQIIVALKCSTMLPAARLKLLGSYLTATAQTDIATSAYKFVLDVHNGDDWEAYLELIQLCTDSKTYVELMNYFTALETKHPLLRGPCLGRLALSSEKRKEFQKELEKLKKLETDVVKEMKHYIHKFGSKPCCYGDIRQYLDVLSNTDRTTIIEYLLSYIQEHDPRTFSENKETKEKEDKNKESTSTPVVNLKVRLNGVRRCIHGHQMLRRLNVVTVSNSKYDSSNGMSMVEEWLSIYEATHLVHTMVLEEEKKQEENNEKMENENEKKKNEAVSGKLQREFHCGDDLILLAVHVLLEHSNDSECSAIQESDTESHSTSKSTNKSTSKSTSTNVPFLRSDYSDANVGTEWNLHRQKCSYAAALIEYGLSKSPDNYHLKLMKLRIYGYLGGSRVALTMYDQLGPKHIQLETLSWWVLDTVENYAQVAELTRLSERIFDMHRRNFSKLPDMMSLAFEHHNVGSVRQFEQFRQDLSQSFCLQRARTLRAFLPFVRNRTPGEDMDSVHNYLKQGVIFEGVSTDLMPPANGQQYINLDLNTIIKLKKNEDRTVLMCWNPLMNENDDTNDDTTNATQNDVSKTTTDTTVAMNRANTLNSRQIRNMKTMMLMPLIMTWSFEKSIDKMKIHYNSMKKLNVWYTTTTTTTTTATATATTTATQGSNDRGKNEISATVDHKAWLVLLASVKMSIEVGTLLYSTKNSKKDSSTTYKKEKIEKCCTLLIQLKDRIQEIGTELVSLMTMQGMEIKKRKCFEFTAMGLLSRFVCTDAITIAILLHSLFRELPSELTKAIKKKSKKSKKNKKTKKNAKHVLESVRDGIVGVAQSLHNVLQLIRTTFKSVLIKSTDIETGLQCLFGLEDVEESNTPGKMLSSLITPERKKFVAKQLLEDWNVGYEELEKIIDDRTQVLLRISGVDGKGGKSKK